MGPLEVSALKLGAVEPRRRGTRSGVAIMGDDDSIKKEIRVDEYEKVSDIAQVTERRNLSAEILESYKYLASTTPP
jgi:hypothetical protein